MPTIALVGCAHIHTPGFVQKIKARPDVQVKYVWDPNPARSAARAEQLQAKVLKSASRIWSDPDVTAVVICSETTLHKKLVAAATAAGKHLFVEKPLGVGAKDAFAMAQAIEQAGVKFQTGYFMRGNPVHLFLREQIQKGLFGRITRARASNCHSGALGGWFDAKPADPANDWRWMADPKIAGCGAFGDLGTHSLDILLWLLGDVREVTAQLDNGTARYEGCEELGEALFRFQNGAIGTLAAGWDDVANPVSLLIAGTRAHAVVVEGKLYLHAGDWETVDGKRMFKPALPGSDGKQPMDGLPAGWPHAFDLFLDAVGGKEASLVTPREAAVRNAVMEAMYQAARKRKWVAVPTGA